MQDGLFVSVKDAAGESVNSSKAVSIGSVPRVEIHCPCGAVVEERFDSGYLLCPACGRCMGLAEMADVMNKVCCAVCASRDMLEAELQLYTSRTHSTKAIA